MTTSTIPRAGRFRVLTAATLLALATAACTGGGSGGGATPAGAVASPSGSGAPSTDVTPVPDVTAKPGISRAPGLPGSPVPGDGDGEGVPPAVVQAAVDDAAARADVDASAVTVVSAESVTWANGALGCPQRGFMYTDVVTPGYRVVVEAGGTRYDYRATTRGDARWCENPPGPG